MTLHVYVAGPSAELERCARMIAAVRELGCEITYDWPAAILARRDLGLEDADLDPDEARDYAVTDLAAVYSADVLVWLGPSGGSLIELGAALMRAPVDFCVCDILVVGPSPHPVFGALVTDRVDTDAEVLEWFRGRIGS